MEFHFRNIVLAMTEGHPNGKGARDREAVRAGAQGAGSWVAVSPDKASKAPGRKGMDHAQHPARDRSTATRLFKLERVCIVHSPSLLLTVSDGHLLSVLNPKYLLKLPSLSSPTAGALPSFA